ncbi:MAG: cell division protein FtsA [bacterium]|nr:cell division protein FtsA [bacterium]
MATNHYIAALDIGTHTIKALVVNQKKGDDLEVVFQTQKESKGVRRGIVVKPEDVSYILQDIFNQLKIELNKKIDSLYVNIDGSHLFCQPSHGLISVSRADRKISKEDVDRVLQEAQVVSLPPLKEIFDFVPQEFIVDGERGIKEAQGLQGVRLEADILAIGGFSPYLKNHTQAISNSDFQILDRIPSPMAAASACLTEKQKELGTAIVDIGAGTSGLAVFKAGDLIHLAILPMGSANITEDIAIGFKTEMDLAERIKLEYGSCQAAKNKKMEKIKVEGEESLMFSRKQLLGIIVPRVSEIFREINRQLKGITKERSLPGGVVLTGGGAKLPNMVDLAKKEFKLPVRIGKPQGILDLDDPIWSVSWGLVLNGLNLENQENTSSDHISGIGDKIKKVFKSFIP